MILELGRMCDQGRLAVYFVNYHIYQMDQVKAKKMAQKLASKNVKADLIVASPAVRTVQTAEIFAEELGYRKNVMYNDVLYMAYVNELIETITYTFDTVDSMVLVAHNPSLTALAVSLVGFKEKILPGGIVEVEFNCNSWIDISKENASLVSYEYPDK